MMNSIRNIARLNDIELANCTPPNGSWHTDYRDTAFIHIGGLPFDLSEGDVLVIFSQYGSPVHISLARDKDTGKSRGFAWLKYEDQRSADLAVDNLSGAVVLGRTLSVDHARYKMREGERETVGGDVEEEEEDAVDSEGDRRGKKRRKSDDGESEEERPMVKEEVELAKLMREHDDDDPMKKYLIEQKKAEVEEALKAVTISKPKRKGEDDGERKHRHRHHHRSRRERSEEDVDDRRRNGHRSRKDEAEDDVKRHSKDRARPSATRERSSTPARSDEEMDRRKRRSRREHADSADGDRPKRKDDNATRKRRYSSEDRSRSREPYRRQ